jgi:hypothetical protein
MSTQLAQIETTQPVTPGITALQLAEDDLLDTDMLDPDLDPGMLDSGRSTSVARGVASAVLIATPFWALFAFAIYLLI